MIVDEHISAGIVLMKNFTLTAFGGFIDTLRLGADEGDRSRQRRFRWDVMTLDDREVSSSCGVNLSPTCSLRSGKPFDYLVVVGGLLREDSQDDWAELADVIRRHHEAGCWIVGICNGVFAIAHTGLLDGRICSISWFHAEEFTARFPAIEIDTRHQSRLDGRIWTCAGGVGAMRLGLLLVQRHAGKDVAEKCSRILMFDHRDLSGAVQPSKSVGTEVKNHKLRKALMELELHYMGKVDFDAMARNVGLSRRHLERLFRSELGKSPGEVIHDWRMEEAATLVRATDWSFTQIAYEVGFSSQSHFGTAFRRRYACSPGEYRAGAA